MGKFYDQPEIVQTQPPVINNASAEQPDVKKTLTLKDIYIKHIDEFDLYVKGKVSALNGEKRQEKVIDFITSFESMLNGEYGNVKPALHHFIKVINASPQRYGSGEMFAPLYKMKNVPYKVKPERFIDLVCFLIGIAENIRDVRRYIGGRDVPYFLRDFSPKQRENLVHFVEDLTR